DQRVDDNCSFFISLDKQAAYRDEVRLGQGITLRAKVEAYPAKKEAAVENAKEALS
ncbi:RNA-binding domain-containing protein, partial [Haladaptatus sp. AB643]